MVLATDWPALLTELFEARRAVFQISREKLSRGEPVDPEDTPGRLAFECVMDSLRRGIPCPDWAARAAIECWDNFTCLKVKTLGDAFQIEDQKHIAAARAHRLCAAVYTEVRRLEREVPQKSNKDGKSALEIAGDHFHMSPSQIEKKVREWRDLCRENGSDPDAVPKFVDARDVMFPAFAEGLALGKSTQND